MQVKQVLVSPSKQYPYTHRITFKDFSQSMDAYDWIEKNNVPGTWISSSNAFYTTAKYATLMSLIWSHE